MHILYTSASYKYCTDRWFSDYHETLSVNPPPLYSPEQKKEMLMAKPVKELSGFLPYGRIGLI